MRIFTRLLLLFLLVAVLPLALFVYFNLQQNEAVLRAEALGRVSTLADKKVMQVKNYLLERERNVRFLAKSPSVTEGLKTLSVTYGQRSGATYVREDALVRQYLERYVEDSGVFYDLFLITPEGEIVYTQKHGSDFATNLQSGPWRSTPLAEVFRNVRMTLEPVISRQDKYEPSKNAALFIAAPVMADGKFIGVLAAQLGNDLFFKIASNSVGMGMSGEAVFARKDREDMVMTTPLKYRPGGKEILRLNLKENKDIPMVGALFGKSGEDVRVDYRNMQVVSAWRYLPELDWGMVVKVDGDEVFSSIHRQRIILLEVLLTLLFFSGMLAFYFARQISAPLEGLAKTAGEMAQGNLQMRADESAVGELGMFAKAFNHMAFKLQGIYHTLEDRIEERTRELNASNEQLQKEILEREHIESALRDNQTKLQRKQELLVEAERLGRIGSWERDLASGELRWSDEMYRMFELDPAQVAPSYENLLKAIHPEDRDRVSQAYMQSLESRQLYDAEFRLRMEDGRIKWVREHGNSYFDESGKALRSVGAVQDITERKLAEEEIRNLAFYDALTGLPNRRLLLDRFRLAQSLTARSRHYGAVMFLDMDKFKTLNDTLGHDYGDLMLVEVARRLQSCVREADTVARLGGDEFVVLLEVVDGLSSEASQNVALIAEKIRAELTVPYQLGSYEYHGSTSIGVSLYRGDEEPVDVLLKQADLAMYQAKNSGRNAVRFFDPKMQQAVDAHASLEADLRRAVPDEQLRLYYQIQVDNNRHVLGVEALVRWVHPVRGLVSPEQFIPVAEESALILDIGGWVFETACRQLAVWRGNELTRHLSIAVNVSAQQFKLPDFVDRVAAVLRTFDVEASQLKLELTESVVLSDVVDVAAKMHALKALGVKLSLDDFGTGYSSLSYLKQLPLDQLKIDKSFVRDIATDPNDAVMVQTIIDMAQNFRLSVIAEGVETEDQLDFLKRHGCMAYQGYLFGKPMPIGDVEKSLERAG